MLTNNFTEIVHAAAQQLNSNTTGSLSSEDMRNISLMLLGYLRLIKSGFKTKEDSNESSEEYYSALKSMLDDVSKAQTRAIKKVKEGLLIDFNSELDELEKKIQALCSLGQQNKEGPLKTAIKIILLLRKTLNEDLIDEYIGFKTAMKSYFMANSALEDALNRVSNHHTDSEFLSTKEFASKITTSHFKILTHWNDIEQINQICLSYVVSSEFIDLLTFN